MNLLPKLDQIQIWDSVRQFFLAALIPLAQTSGMLVLILVFDARTDQKTVFAISISSGLLLGIPFAILVSSRKWSVNRVLCITSLAAAAALVWAASAPFTWLFIALICVSVFALSGINPILSEIYTCFPRESRGSKLTASMAAMIIGSIVAAMFFGHILNDDVQRYPYVLYLSAVCAILAAAASLKLPAVTFAKNHAVSVASMIAILKRDRLFVLMSIAWFILGSANLWLMPYRTNLLIESQFGFEYSPGKVMFLLVVVPQIAHLVALPATGKLFDRCNLVALRVVINLVFILYVALFFIGTNLLCHVLAVVCFGLNSAGGTISWRLWVNKLAPPDEVPAYMTLHSGLTGVRAIVMPLFGLYCLNVLGPSVCAWISISLILVSTAILVPLIKFGPTHFHR